MSSNPFRIMVVHDQPATVWSLSKFLKSAGYEVTQVAGGEHALQALDCVAPHFVIAGWDMAPMGGLEFTNKLRSRNLADYIYVFLLVADAGSNDLVEALRAGADDFLREPPVHGELLSRLRAGARILEFERRLRGQSRTDPLTGLPARLALDESLSGQLAVVGRRRSAACVLADLDLFSRVNHLYGWPFGDQVLVSVARRLEGLAGDKTHWHRIGDNRFAAVLAESSEQEALARAERWRAALAELAIEVDRIEIRLTASFGVAQLVPGLSAEEALDLAEQPLLAAKQSGRNQAVAAGAIETVTGDRGGILVAIDPLRSALARDVMTSNVVSFNQGETLAAAAEFMRDSRLSILPVVDPDGKLLGTVSESELLGRLLSDPLSSKPVEEALVADVPHYEEDTTVQTLYEYFQRENVNRVEIVSAGRPTGFVTRGSLAALGEALNPDTFASPAAATNQSAYLLVPDLAWVEEV
ncbi:MAG: diguanylate cyclase [Pirellulales bacterium]